MISGHPVLGQRPGPLPCRARPTTRRLGAVIVVESRGPSVLDIGIATRQLPARRLPGAAVDPDPTDGPHYGPRSRRQHSKPETAATECTTRLSQGRPGVGWTRSVAPHPAHSKRKSVGTWLTRGGSPISLSSDHAGCPACRIASEGHARMANMSATDNSSTGQPSSAYSAIWLPRN